MNAAVFVGIVRPDGSRLDFDYPDAYRAFIGTLAGDEVEIEIRKKRAKRTLKQNAYLHAVIKPYADHLGYTVEELKLALLGECFGYHEVSGVALPLKLHTADLSTTEFVDITELLIQKAAEDGIILLYPDEFTRAKRKRQRKDSAGRRAMAVRPRGAHPPSDRVAPSDADSGQ